MSEEGLDRLPPPARRFGTVAELYDRSRPAYPQALVDDLLAAQPRDILDVGCGTAKAGRLFVGPGRRVVGVEPDPLMAEVARRYGIEVEIAEFEHWDACDRSFDLLVSGTAWHWVDAFAGAAKAADVLRPGGRFAAFWNEMIYSEPVRAVFTEVYERHAPELLRTSYVLGVVDPIDSESDVSGRGLVAAGFADVVPGQRKQYDWTLEYRAAEWADLVATHSDHRALDPGRLNRLLTDLIRALEPLGPFTVQCRTDVLSATRE
ncbi:MAG TPA: class I SAM-dependent methyltransferase [Acidimicrobiales bacterium]|nr:class I SAM-dependent methyltransferase [Acidimicrobiales bacterium]